MPAGARYDRRFAGGTGGSGADGSSKLRLLYTTLIRLIAPAALLFMLWRGFRDRGYWERIGERFGFTRLRFDRDSIWIHAVSVGEVQAAATLVRRLAERYPGVPLVVTTVTPTGAQRVKSLFQVVARHCFIPYDLPGSVRRFFDRTRPRLAIIVETELWPNLFHECGDRGIPLVLASARISPRTVSRYRRLVGLFRETLSHGIVIAAQTESDAERFRSIGANPARTHVVGNIKFDLEISAAARAGGIAFRSEHAPGRAVWIAGSTHESEEEAALDAHALVRQRVPDALLLLVPRHPNRFDTVRALLSRRAVGFVSRASGRPLTAETSVYLVDTLGELLMFYGAADVAFVGGSLVPAGGHNLLEPAALGLPILTGPHNFNSEDIAQLFLEAGAARLVRSVAELGGQVSDLLADRQMRDDVGNRGLDLVERNRGTVHRLLELIDPLMAGAGRD